MTPDFAVFSYPKCGRTWVRFLLAWYLSDYFRLGLDVDFHSVFQLMPNYSNDPQRGVPAFAFASREDVPKVVFSHLPVEPNLSIPLVFLSRCPLDTLVSEFFQKKERQKVLTGDISEYLRSPQGVAGLCNYYNYSCESLKRLQASRPVGNILLLSYEQLHGDTQDALRQLLSMMDVSFEQERAEAAIEQSSFSRMRQTEIEKGFPGAPVTVQPDSANGLRAREGKIGGYRKHLDEADVRFGADYLTANLVPAVTQVLPKLLTNIT